MFCIADVHGPWILWCWAVNKQLHSCSVSGQRSKEYIFLGKVMSCKGIGKCPNSPSQNWDIYSNRVNIEVRRRLFWYLYHIRELLEAIMILCLTLYGIKCPSILWSVDPMILWSLDHFILGSFDTLIWSELNTVSSHWTNLTCFLDPEISSCTFQDFGANSAMDRKHSKVRSFDFYCPLHCDMILS